MKTVEESALSGRDCVPCQAGISPLKGEALQRLLGELGHGWRAVDEHHLEKEYAFRNFREALDFTNKVGELAEKVNHHPEIWLTWGQAKVTIWTHKIGGLSEADFIFAAKVDAL
jgi:4a-hydroxytetrahydrobiopterin dehydratase